MLDLVYRTSVSKKTNMNKEDNNETNNTSEFIIEQPQPQQEDILMDNIKSKNQPKATSLPLQNQQQQIDLSNIKIFNYNKL
jgi:hypothetical protein